MAGHAELFETFLKNIWSDLSTDPSLLVHTLFAMSSPLENDSYCERAWSRLHFWLKEDGEYDALRENNRDDNFGEDATYYVDFSGDSTVDSSVGVSRFLAFSNTYDRDLKTDRRDYWNRKDTGMEILHHVDDMNVPSMEDDWDFSRHSIESLEKYIQIMKEHFIRKTIVLHVVEDAARELRKIIDKETDNCDKAHRQTSALVASV
ncbi:hypothetical protein BOTCAL_0981g00010 [Botryotinia calthae]|uniref:Uncharacterized protein n=1 Tax=Botryotinia calthae TaxID=38488 RepID=A0A4Y8CGX0_9HELO|nr:hypothetical protein BOTCAL_0981g00010 [Botryotinia calthae]